MWVSRPSPLLPAAAALIVALAGCAPARAPLPPSPPAGVATEPPPRPAPPPPPPRHPGVVTGAALSEAAEAGVPPIEQGWSGLLQGVPLTKPLAAGRVEAAWAKARNVADLGDRAKAIARSGLRRQVCEDLVDLRGFEGRGLPPFRWRDRVRGRTWVTPAAAVALIDAQIRFASKHPDARLTIGDISQPGCGQLRHNVLVHWVEGADAEALLNDAVLLDGLPTAVSHAVSGDFPDEAIRFEAADIPIRIERRIVARDAAADELRLRVETMRYALRPPAEDSSREDEVAAAKRAMGGATLVETLEVATRDDEAEHGLQRHWLQRWVLPETRRQYVTRSRRKLKRKLVPGWLEGLSAASWQLKKPGSRPAEVRWIREVGPEGPVWTRWGALYEAGHISHVAGRDVDIAYVTEGNASPFAVDLEVLDVPRTWAWLQALEAAAKAAGAPLERILVDRKILKRLDAGLPKAAKRTRLYKELLRRSGGHDAHHHVRFAEASRAATAKALEVLDQLVAAAAAERAQTAEASAPGEDAAAIATDAAAAPEPIVGSSPTPER